MATNNRAGSVRINAGPLKCVQLDEKVWNLNNGTLIEINIRVGISVKKLLNLLHELCTACANSVVHCPSHNEQ